MTTNEFERDVNDQSGLKRPGRIDLRVFQNTPDAGDGHPGVQRCFRNYLHEGGMEKDLDLIDYSIKGTSVDINNAEMQQLSNIGATTISGAQWVFVGQADQDVRQADSPTFNGLTLSSLTVNGAITITGNVDGVDVSDLKSAFDTHKASTGVDHTYIDQSVIISSSPTFVGLTLSANVVTSSTFDSVDVSDLKSAFDTHKASTGVDHTYIDQSVKQADSPTFVGLTLSADLVTASTIDGVDVSGIKLNSMPTAADGDITANTQKITNVVDPTSDQDASTKKYTDDNDVWYKESDDLVFSNDPENIRNETDYAKVKEIKCYIHANIRLYWEHYRHATSDTGKTRVYINGVAVSTERSATTGYTSETHDMKVAAGDLIQIWGYAYQSEPLLGKSIYVKYMRIKYVDFINNDP